MHMLAWQRAVSGVWETRYDQMCPAVTTNGPTFPPTYAIVLFPSRDPAHVPLLDFFTIWFSLASGAPGLQGYRR
jgi:hypothetical protein